MKQKISLSEKSNLRLPVGRILKKLKSGNYSQRYSKTAAVYMSAVIEYLLCEIIECSGDLCKKNKRMRITPRDINLSIKNDSDFNHVMDSVYLSEGGVVPNSIFLSKPQ